MGEQPGRGERNRDHQRRVGRRRGEGERRRVGPDFRRQGLRADRRQDQRGGQLGDDGDEHQSCGRAEAGARERQRHPNRDAHPAEPQRTPRLLEAGLRLHQHRAHADQGQRQEQDGVSDDERGRALVERPQRMHGQRNEGQSHDDRRHSLRQIGGAFEKRDPPAAIARSEIAKRQSKRQRQRRRRGSELQRGGGGPGEQIDRHSDRRGRGGRVLQSARRRSSRAARPASRSTSSGEPEKNGPERKAQPMGRSPTARARRRPAHSARRRGGESRGSGRAKQKASRTTARREASGPLKPVLYSA